MSAAARVTPLTALACAIVAIGGLLILKGVYDWIGQRSDVAAQPFQRDRVVIYLAALVVAGAAMFALTGERGPALAVLATAAVPVLLILPGSVTRYTALYTCLITVTVGAAMALRTVLAPGTSVTLVSVMAFFVISVAGGYLLGGGLALLPVPLMYLLTGHRWLAGLSAAFLLVVLIVLMDRDDALGWLVYAITGPMAMGAAIYALFAD